MRNGRFRASNSTLSDSPRWERRHPCRPSYFVLGWWRAYLKPDTIRRCSWSPGLPARAEGRVPAGYRLAPAQPSPTRKRADEVPGTSSPWHRRNEIRHLRRRDQVLPDDDPVHQGGSLGQVRHDLPAVPEHLYALRFLRPALLPAERSPWDRGLSPLLARAPHRFIGISPESILKARRTSAGRVTCLCWPRNWEAGPIMIQAGGAHALCWEWPRQSTAARYSRRAWRAKQRDSR